MDAYAYTEDYQRLRRRWVVERLRRPRRFAVRLEISISSKDKVIKPGCFPEKNYHGDKAVTPWCVCDHFSGTI